MELRVEIVRNLPCELQIEIWERYKKTYVHNELMDKVEVILNNREYESINEDCMKSISDIVAKLTRYHKEHHNSFEIAMAYAFDRVLECNSPDMDKLALLHVIQENIKNPYLMKLLIYHTEMIEALCCSKCTQLYVLIETLESVYDLIRPEDQWMEE